MAVGKDGMPLAKKSRTQNTVLNTAAGMTAKAFNIITGFIMRSIFISTLGAEYAGISSLFTDLLTLLSFAELGISSAIAFSLYKPVAEGDNRKISALMQFYKRAYQLVAGVVLGLGLALIPFMDTLVPAEKINPAIRDDVAKYIIPIYVLYVINSAVSYLQIYKATLLTAHQENRKVTSVQMIMSVVRVLVEACILLSLNLVIKENRTIIYIVYLVAGIIITRTTNLIISRYVDKRYPDIDYNTKESLSGEEKKKLYKDVSALMIYKVCSQINTSLDSIVISSFFGPLWVGYVSNYRLAAAKVRQVVLQLFSSVLPSMGNLAVEKDSEYQHKTFKSLQFMAFWICCFCSTCFVVLLNPFIRLWLRNEEFIMSMWMPVIVAAVFYSSTIMNPIASVRNANGLFVQGKYRPVAMCLINIGASILLAISLGQNGAAPEAGVLGIRAATLVSHCLTMQWYDPYIVYKHVFKKPLRSYFSMFFRHLGVTAGSIAVTYGLGILLFGNCESDRANAFAGIFANTPDIVSFIVKCVLCVIIPNAFIILLYRKTEEYRRFVGVFAAFIKKIRNKAAKNSLSAAGTKE